MEAKRIKVGTANALVNRFSQMSQSLSSMKLRFAIVVALSLPCSPVVADNVENDVHAAYRLCQMLDNTGSLTEPCDVSGWSKAVDVSIALTGAEARAACPSIQQLAQRTGLRFHQSWEVRIFSPYYGDDNIAACPL